MNEQLAAIKDRRAAITPGVWRVANDLETRRNVFAFYLWVAAGDNFHTMCGSQYESSSPVANATFIAAAPADIDTLLAHVAALTAERDERSLVAEQLSMVLHIRDTQLAALTAERDNLAQQLQQAQDAAKRQAAYISECVDSDGCYRP